MRSCHTFGANLLQTFPTCNPARRRLGCMATTSEHVAAEQALRKLLPSTGLPQPDEVEYREESVVFLWHETKLAVVIDLDGTDADDERPP